MLRRALLISFLMLLVLILNAFLNPIPKKNIVEGFKPSYGVSYSFEQAGWYGLEGRKSYTELLDSVEFDWVRLPFFWDQTLLRSEEAPEGQVTNELDLGDLKFAIEEAAKRNVDVIIALGAKTPYFPEYHWPKEIESQVKFGERIDINHPVADDILEIDRMVVEALAKYDNIVFWQVENEPLLGNVNKWKIEPSLLAKEVELVRLNDPKKRPIILNHAATGFYDTTWRKLLPILAPGDAFAVNAFVKTKGTDLITAKIFGKELHFLWPDRLVWPVHSWLFFSPDFVSIKKTVEGKGLTFMILEMQAEPYIKKLEESRDPLLYFTPDDIEAADKFLRSYKVESVGLWGAHFWQYKQKNGDGSWLEKVESIVN